MTDCRSGMSVAVETSREEDHTVGCQLLIEGWKTGNQILPITSYEYVTWRIQIEKGFVTTNGHYVLGCLSSTGGAWTL